jgi:hypothetical protein
MIFSREFFADIHDPAIRAGEECHGILTVLQQVESAPISELYSIKFFSSIESAQFFGF